MSLVRSMFAALCLASQLSLVAFSAPQAGGVPKPTFKPATIEAAKSLAGTFSNAGPVTWGQTHVSHMRSSAYASTGKGLIADGQGGVVEADILTIYPENFAIHFKDLGLAGMDSIAAINVLAIILFHESLHVCCDNDGMGKARNSCEHAFIAASEHAAVCTQAAALCSAIASEENSQEVVALEDALDLLCARAKQIEDYWNSPRQSQKMSQCARGVHSNPFPPEAGCGGEYPPVPPGGITNENPSDYPGGIPLPSCSSCGGCGNNEEEQ